MIVVAVTLCLAALESIQTFAQFPRDATVEVGRQTTFRLRREINPRSVRVVTDPAGIARGWYDSNLNRFRIEGLAPGTTRMVFSGTYRAIIVGNVLRERAVNFSETIDVRVLPGERPLDTSTIRIQVSRGAHRDYAFHVLLGPDFRNRNEEGVRWRNIRLSGGDDRIADGIDDLRLMKLRITGVRNGRTQITLHGERMDNRVWRPVQRVLDIRVGTGRNSAGAGDITPVIEPGDAEPGNAEPGNAEPASWSTTPARYRNRNGERFTFRCASNPRGSGSTVWGTDVYTDDSSVCIAAVHAGLITFASGGVVTIEIRPGLASYRGSQRNGVATQAWNSWAGSFVFVR